MKYTAEQQQILDFAKYLDAAHIFINARAGTGKTTTILELMKEFRKQHPLLKNKLAYFVYNAAAKEDIDKKIASTITVKGKNGKDKVVKAHRGLTSSVLVTTPNAYAFGCLPMVIKEHIWKNKPNSERKETDLFTLLFKKHLLTEADKLDEKEGWKKRKTNLLRFYRICKCFNAVFSTQQVFDVALDYNNSINSKEAEFIINFWQAWIRKRDKDLTYQDSVMLAANGQTEVTEKYILFIDECQDLDETQFQLIMRMVEKGAKTVWVGDDKQAIYGFRGASARMFQKIKTWVEHQNLKEGFEGEGIFNLTTNFRSPQAVLDIANNFAGTEMKALDKSRETRIATIKDLASIPKKAAVLARTNSLLVELALELLKSQTKFSFAGASGIANKIKYKVSKYYNNFLAWQNDIELDETLSENEKNQEADLLIALQSVYSKLKIKTKEYFLHAINLIFTESDSSLKLMTIHKSKGLEFDDVVIVTKDYPSRFATTELEQIQEQNLGYIALTRTKKNLYFLGNAKTFHESKIGVFTKKERFIEEDDEFLKEPVYITAYEWDEYKTEQGFKRKVLYQDGKEVEILISNDLIASFKIALKEYGKGYEGFRIEYKNNVYDFNSNKDYQEKTEKNLDVS